MADVNILRRAYHDSIGSPMPPMVHEQVSRLDVEIGMVIEAVREAATAPRPSWRYAMAIIGKCIAEGVTTLEGYQRRQEAWTRRSPGGRCKVDNPALQYEQRTYTDELLDSLFEDFSAT